MTTFRELHLRALELAAAEKSPAEVEQMMARLKEYDRGQLDCLFEPDAQGLEDVEMITSTSASTPADQSSLSKDSIVLLEAMENKKGYVYALVAPAFIGQYGDDVSPGQLRSALKRIGFDGMIELAIFADILTLKEALEFDERVQCDTDFHLTSCCCPMWISMIRKLYGELMPHIPPSVSPMIAGGRTIKKLHPDAITVFIGPCMAKKAEAKEEDVRGAIDFVLTFQEMEEIFVYKRTHPAYMSRSDREYSSRTGRIYARAGGVCEAVQKTLARINPDKKIAIRTQKADGVPACKIMLNDLRQGNHTANFYEGMGCVGGCVGGPKSVIQREEATDLVDDYGDGAIYPTPIENPYVIELMSKLGFDTVEDLLEKSDIFTRELR